MWLYKTCFGNFSLTYLSWCPMHSVFSSVFQGQCMNSLLDHDGELVCAKEREGNYQSVVTAIQITMVLHYSKLCMGSKSVCMLLCMCVRACTCVCDWWSLIKCYSPLSWADSLCSHVVLHEWLAFYGEFFDIHQSGVSYSVGMAGATGNCSCLGAFSVYTMQPCTMSLHAKPHT